MSLPLIPHSNAGEISPADNTTLARDEEALILEVQQSPSWCKNIDAAIIAHDAITTHYPNDALVVRRLMGIMYLRYECIEEIPTGSVDALYWRDTTYEYKADPGWLVETGHILKFIIDEKLPKSASHRNVSEQQALISNIKTYLNLTRTLRPKPHDKLTPEQIQAGNEILDKTLDFFVPKPNSP